MGLSEGSREGFYSVRESFFKGDFTVVERQYFSLNNCTRGVMKDLD